MLRPIKCIVVLDFKYSKIKFGISKTEIKPINNKKNWPKFYTNIHGSLVGMPKYIFSAYMLHVYLWNGYKACLAHRKPYYSHDSEPLLVGDRAGFEIMCGTWIIYLYYTVPNSRLNTYSMDFKKWWVSDRKVYNSSVYYNLSLVTLAMLRHL